MIKMRLKRFAIQTGRLPMLPLFMGGILLGILVTNLANGMLQSSGLLDEDTLYQMKYMSVDRMSLFAFVLRKRMGESLLFALCCSTYLGLLLCGGALMWYGMATGTYLSLLIWHYGAKGVLFAIVSIFPQYLFYVPAYILLFLWGEELYRGIYQKRNRAGDPLAGLELPKRLLRLLIIQALFLIGCLTEAFLNPGLLQGLLKIF